MRTRIQKQEANGAQKGVRCSRKKGSNVVQDHEDKRRRGIAVKGEGDEMQMKSR